MTSAKRTQPRMADGPKLTDLMRFLDEADVKSKESVSDVRTAGGGSVASEGVSVGEDADGPATVGDGPTGSQPRSLNARMVALSLELEVTIGGRNVPE